jgi:peroxiredoxin family protein
MIVPSFDDPQSTGRKLAIICSKGNLDMAYPGLILANAAVGEGIETHLFFTFWGFDIINKATMGDLQVLLRRQHRDAPCPGHSGMACHHMLGAARGDQGRDEDDEEADRRPRRARRARVPRDAHRLRCHMWACRMSADMNT